MSVRAGVYVFVVGFLAPRCLAAVAGQAPWFVVPGKRGIPVIVNPLGFDASYQVVEGDFGLDRPAQVNPIIVGGPHVLPAPYYPAPIFRAQGRQPGYGRFEVGRRAAPPDAAVPGILLTAAGRRSPTRYRRRSIIPNPYPLNIDVGVGGGWWGGGRRRPGPGALAPVLAARATAPVRVADRSRSRPIASPHRTQPTKSGNIMMQDQFRLLRHRRDRHACRRDAGGGRLLPGSRPQLRLRAGGCAAVAPLAVVPEMYVVNQGPVYSGPGPYVTQRNWIEGDQVAPIGYPYVGYVAPPTVLAALLLSGPRLSRGPAATSGAAAARLSAVLRPAASYRGPRSAVRARRGSRPLRDEMSVRRRLEQIEPLARDIERERGGVRDVEALDPARQVEPRDRSQVARVSCRSPLPSAPSTSASGARSGTSARSLSPLLSRPTTQVAALLQRRRARGRDSAPSRSARIRARRTRTSPARRSPPGCGARW